MILKPGYGIDNVLFGMRRHDVEALLGTPSKEYRDEDDNLILLYNDAKLRLTFYAEEGLRLGYLITAHPETEWNGIRPITADVEKAVSDFSAKGLRSWTSEAFDTYENQVNEDNWLILQSEFGIVIKVELGAFINEKTDEFDWKFK